MFHCFFDVKMVNIYDFILQRYIISFITPKKSQKDTKENYDATTIEHL